MQTNYLKLLFGCLVLAGVSMAINAYTPLMQLEVGEPKWQWIRKQIFFEPKQNVDYVFLGSSHCHLAIRPDVISEALGGAKVWNLCRSSLGRDVDYVTIRALLEKHNVRNIVLEFSHYESFQPHPYSRFVVSSRELPDEVSYIAANTTLRQALTMSQPFKDKLRLLAQIMGNVSVRTYSQLYKLIRFGGSHDCLSAECTGNDTTLGFDVKDPTRPQSPKFIEKFKNVKIDPSHVVPRQFPSDYRSIFYLGKIQKLVEKKKANLLLVYIPDYDSPLPSAEMLAGLGQYGRTLIPNAKDLFKMEYWYDFGHFYHEGSILFSKRVADEFLKIQEPAQIKKIGKG